MFAEKEAGRHQHGHPAGLGQKREKAYEALRHKLRIS
jgi:hypothetical protein